MMNSAFGTNVVSCCTRCNIALVDLCVPNWEFMFKYGKLVAMFGTLAALFLNYFVCEMDR